MPGRRPRPPVGPTSPSLRHRSAGGAADWRTIIGAVRHNPSTVVVLAGKASDQVLADVGRAMNVVLVRPGGDADRADGAAGIDSAAGALRRATGISAPYVLVAADPLAAVAAEWAAMWEITPEQRGSEGFELRAAEALAAWRANRFELPDYYLVLAEESGASATPGASASSASSFAPREHRPDFYLGPLRSVRPHRVAVATAAEPAAQAAAVLSELGSLRVGRWWPSLDEVFRTARGFYPGALTESHDAGQATLLS